MRHRILASAFVAIAASSFACSSPSGEETGTAEGAVIGPCVEGSALPCPPQPPVSIVGNWSRRAGALQETLQLRADNSYSLTEYSVPVCVRAPCPEMPVIALHTEGTYVQSDTLIKLSPVTSVPQLPEAFDIVKRPPFPIPDGAPQAALTIAPTILLHAVEQGRDIFLSRTGLACPTPSGPCYPPPVQPL